MVSVPSQDAAVAGKLENLSELVEEITDEISPPGVPLPLANQTSYIDNYQVSVSILYRVSRKSTPPVKKLHDRTPG